jgi:hypothetical protein
MNAIKDSDVFMSLMLVFFSYGSYRRDNVALLSFFLSFSPVISSSKMSDDVVGSMETAGLDGDPAEHLKECYHPPLEMISVWPQNNPNRFFFLEEFPCRIL